ncbi:MAG TPA: DUF2752 domain-containing protein [Ktedonobacterales bacterium]
MAVPPASRPLPPLPTSLPPLLPPAGRPRLRLALLGGLGIVYAGYAWLAHGRDLPVMCPYRRLTGHRCPLCGATTALGHLLHGAPRAAFRAHPLAPPAALVALIWYLYSAFAAAPQMRRRRREDAAWLPRAWRSRSTRRKRWSP